MDFKKIPSWVKVVLSIVCALIIGFFAVIGVDISSVTELVGLVFTLVSDFGLVIALIKKIIGGNDE